MWWTCLLFLAYITTQKKSPGDCSGAKWSPKVQCPVVRNVFGRSCLGCLDPLCGVKVLVHDEVPSISNYLHLWLQVVSQNFLENLGGDPLDLRGRRMVHDVRCVGRDHKDRDKEERLGVLYDVDLFHVLPDPPVVMLVALLVLVEGLLLKKFLSIPADFARARWAKPLPFPSSTPWRPLWWPCSPSCGKNDPYPAWSSGRSATWGSQFQQPSLGSFSFHHCWRSSWRQGRSN